MVCKVISMVYISNKIIGFFDLNNSILRENNIWFVSL